MDNQREGERPPSNAPNIVLWSHQSRPLKPVPLATRHTGMHGCMHARPINTTPCKTWRDSIQVDMTQ